MPATWVGAGAFHANAVPPAVLGQSVGGGGRPMTLASFPLPPPPPGETRPALPSPEPAGGRELEASQEFAPHCWTLPGVGESLVQAEQPGPKGPDPKLALLVWPRAAPPAGSRSQGSSW